VAQEILHPRAFHQEVQIASCVSSTGNPISVSVLSAKDVEEVNHVIWLDAGLGAEQVTCKGEGYSEQGI